MICFGFFLVFNFSSFNKSDCVCGPASDDFEIGVRGQYCGRDLRKPPKAAEAQ